MSNYHSPNLHQSPFLATQMYPGFVEPPPPYGAATAPFLNASNASPSVGLMSNNNNSRGEHSPTSAAFAGDNSQQRLAIDKFHPSAEQQQTNNTSTSSNSTNSSSSGSNNIGGGHQQHLPYYQPQMPSAQQQTMTTSETSVLPPGAVPFAMHPSPIVHSIYSSQSIPMGHSFPVGGPNVPNHAQIVKMIIAVPLGPHEVKLDCSNCRQSVRTRVIRRPGLLTWIICGALALVGCWPCCVLPFCTQSCQDAEHYCANCNAFIGKYSRI